MKIEGYYDLLVLHRTVLEAKFSDMPNDPDVMVSPLVAKMANQIIDEIIVSLEKNGDKDSVMGWKEWRLGLKNRLRERGIIKKNIASLKDRNVWSGLTVERKREIIRDLAAPFILNGDEVETFLDEI